MKGSFYEKAISRADKLTNEQLRNIANTLVQDNMLLEAALQSMFDGIVVCNLDNVAIFVNRSAERILKISPTVNDTDPFWMAIADEELKDFFCWALTSEETILGKEFALEGSSGTRIISISLSALLSGDRSDKISGTIIHIEDITEKRKKESQLRRAESLAALTTLAAGVAHEINNPLGSISIHIQLIEKLLAARDPPDVAGIQKHLDIVTEEIERLKQIVVDFLFAVRPVDVTLMKDNPGTIVREVVELVKYEAEKNSVTVNLDIADDIPDLLLDKRQIKQAILNLAQNAIAAMPNGGTLTFGVRVVNEEVQISVSDTGVGIPESQLSKIFEPYFTTKKNGTGLGLTITFKIIKEHSGDITVESKEGKGSTFTIHLPIPQQEKKSLPTLEETAPLAGSHKEQ
ncbi:MAG TPA: ATP-binding protein [Spirochaetales bacterium]|nr:ATP-binding protein [Spirochaetales bacterium]HPS14303.1 ATP-binding protein [Spirochaetales bacterium]